MRSIFRAAARATAARLHRGRGVGIETRLVRSLCLAGALVTAGCGDNGTWSLSNSTGGDPDEPLIVVQDATGTLPAFFATMERAQYTTAFLGLRRVILHRDTGVFDYLELVGADGQGRMAVEVRQVFRSPPDFEPLYAQLLLAQRGRFGYRVRDPQVTDLARFELNWVVTVLARDTLIAGQTCWRLDVRRATPLSTEDSVYELAVEPRSGLVLAWRETDMVGNVRSEVEFLTFELGADVGAMDLRERDFDVVKLDPTLDFSTQIGAPVHHPTLAPPGFEFEVAELITLPTTAPPSAGEPGDEWVKFAYTDGFERVFFMHLVDRSVTLPAPSTSNIVHFPFGSWTFAVGNFRGCSVIAAGKVPDQYLAELIQSAVR